METTENLKILSVAPFGVNTEAPPIEKSDQFVTPEGRIIPKEYVQCAYFDGTDLWMGDSSKANAKLRLDAANSRITVFSGGDFTNSTEDFFIQNSGIRLAQQTSLNTPGSLAFFDKSNDNLMGGMYRTSSSLILTSIGDTSSENGNLVFQSPSGNSITFLSSDIRMNSLPTSDPGNSGALWQDTLNGNVVKVSTG